jgi:hypothetical protein
MSWGDRFSQAFFKIDLTGAEYQSVGGGEIERVPMSANRR